MKKNETMLPERMLKYAEHFNIKTAQPALRYMFTEEIIKQTGDPNSILTTDDYLRGRAAYRLMNEKKINYCHHIIDTVIDILDVQEPKLLHSHCYHAEIGPKMITIGCDSHKWNFLFVVRDERKYTRVGIEDAKSNKPYRLRDIGMTLTGHPFSDMYYERMAPVMESLYENYGASWNSLDEKITSVYDPIIDAVKDEFDTIFREHDDAAENMVRTLFSDEDFYKIALNMSDASVQVTPFNMNGTLCDPDRLSCEMSYPTRLIEFGFVPCLEKKLSRIRFNFDKGWTVEFRLHNGTAKIESGSLKFDVAFTTEPYGLYQIERAI